MEGPADRAEPRSPVQMGNPGDDILGTSIVWLISRPVAALSHVGGALQETHFSPHDDASSLSMASGSIRARALYSRARFTNAGVADFTSSRSPLLRAASMRVTDANLDPDARRTDAGSYSEREAAAASDSTTPTGDPPTAKSVRPPGAQSADPQVSFIASVPPVLASHFPSYVPAISPFRCCLFHPVSSASSPGEWSALYGFSGWEVVPVTRRARNAHRRPSRRARRSDD